MKFIQEALKNYYMVKHDQKLSVSKKVSLIPSKDSKKISLLWNEHQRIHDSLNSERFDEQINERPNFSYLDLKIKIASEIFKECIFCEKKCQVNRNFETGL